MARRGGGDGGLDGPRDGDPSYDGDTSCDDAGWDALGDRLVDAIRAVRRSTRGQPLQRDTYSVGDTELTPAQVDALEALVERDAWSMEDLAGRLVISPSTATRTVQPLIRLGLAHREADPRNRRFVRVQATATGRSAAATIRQRRLALMRAVLGPMAPDRRLMLAELLQEYLDHLARHAADRAP